MPSARCVRMPEVQKELAINDDQKEKLQDVADDIRQDMQSAPRPNFQNFQDMTDEERQQGLRRHARLNGKAQQVRRRKAWQGLDLGPDDPPEGIAVASPRRWRPGLHRNVVAKLKITDDQKTKIQEIIQKSRPQGGGFDPERDGRRTSGRRQGAARIPRQGPEGFPGGPERRPKGRMEQDDRQGIQVPGQHGLRPPGGGGGGGNGGNA